MPDPKLGSLHRRGIFNGQGFGRGSPGNRHLCGTDRIQKLDKLRVSQFHLHIPLRRLLDPIETLVAYRSLGLAVVVAFEFTCLFYAIGSLWIETHSWFSDHGTQVACVLSVKKQRSEPGSGGRARRVPWKSRLSQLLQAFSRSEQAVCQW